MIHDITHCRGLGCPIKEDCVRYLAHLEVEQGSYTGPVTYFIDDFLCARAREVKNKNNNQHDFKD